VHHRGPVVDSLRREPVVERLLSRCATGVLVVAAVLLWSDGVSGFPSSRLIYARGKGAEQCPDEAIVRKEVAGRLGYDPFFPTADKTIIVRIERGRDQLSGRVELVDSTGIVRGLREVTGEPDRCQDLINTIALTISIAIDPATAAGPVASPRQEASPVPRDEAAPAAAATIGEPEQPGPDAARSAPTPSSVQWSAGVGFFGSLNVNPQLAAGALAFGTARTASASLTLEARADLPSSSNEGFRSHTFVLGVAPCLHLRGVFACAVGSPGWFFASDARAGSSFFLLSGVRLGGEVPLTGPLALGVYGDLLAAVIEPRVVRSGAALWRAPLLSESLAAAALVHF
jgi:hypothetical protein